MKIGIVANQVKDKAVILAEEVISYITGFNHDYVYCKNIYMDNNESALLNDVDFIVVLGGDGTILSLVRILQNKNVPILGVNLGTLGFITETDPENYKSAIDNIINGQYYISERMMLKATLNNGSEKSEYYALNEFLVGKCNNARLVSINSYINDKFLVNYKADGILVACSTGSTAYNLSAGGPVMHPGVRAYIITPICPHALSERPLIVPETEIFKIKVAEGNNALFTIDGQLNKIINENDTVTVEVSQDTVKLIEFNKTGFYDKLKSRLFWGK